MAFTVSERRSPTVHGYVLDQLRVSPGPVNDVYMVAATSYHHPDGIFKAMHTALCFNFQFCLGTPLYLENLQNNFTYCLLTISLRFSLYIKFAKVNEKDE